jgi:predicted membrane metal-binding protein
VFVFILIIFFHFIQGLLFFLLFFIFAALGVELFGKLECTEERPCSGLDKHAHFKDFGIAFLTLFRIATGDNWNGIMKVCNPIRILSFVSHL